MKSTHLKDLQKLKKLVGILSIAYAIVANVGLHAYFKRDGIPKSKVLSNGKNVGGKLGEPTRTVELRRTIFSCNMSV